MRLQADALQANALAVLSGWTPPDAEQGRLRDRFVAHLVDHADGTSRDCHPEHVTASALVVDPRRTAVLLNHHRKYDRWLQFGGHCEPGDPTLADAALREAREESGIDGLRLVDPAPARLSRHEVRCGPVRPSYHLDVQYLLEAPGVVSPRVSEESVDVRWFDAADLPAGCDAAVLALVRAATRV